jgi:hypothetical protein
MVAVFKPEEPSPPLTPESEAARKLLNDEERKILEAMESDLGRTLTEEEERLALEPGALIELPRPKILLPIRSSIASGDPSRHVGVRFLKRALLQSVRAFHQPR